MTRIELHAFKKGTNIGRYVYKKKIEKKNGCHDNNFCHYFHETTYINIFHWYKHAV